MALIGKDNVLYISDRIAKRFKYLLLAAISGAPNGGGTYGNFWEACHVCPNGDSDIELPTLSLANGSDNAWLTSNTDTVALALTSSVTNANTIVGGLTTHFAAMSLTGGWNQFLNTASNVVNPTNPSNSTGVRVSDYFRKVFGRSGGGTLYARNVFYDMPLAFVFGTGQYNGGSSFDFWVGGNFGDGGATRIANGTYYAATQLQVTPVGGAIGAADLIVNITGLTEAGTPATLSSVTIPMNSPAGTPITIGTVTDRFVSVTAITYVSGGTNGDRFEVQNKTERDVAL